MVMAVVYKRQQQQQTQLVNNLQDKEPNTIIVQVTTKEATMFYNSAFFGRQNIFLSPGGQSLSSKEEASNPWMMNPYMCPCHLLRILNRLRQTTIREQFLFFSCVLIVTIHKVDHWLFGCFPNTLLLEIQRKRNITYQRTRLAVEFYRPRKCVRTWLWNRVTPCDSRRNGKSFIGRIAYLHAARAIWCLSQSVTSLWVTGVLTAPPYREHETKFQHGPSLLVEITWMVFTVNWSKLPKQGSEPLSERTAAGRILPRKASRQLRTRRSRRRRR